MCNGLTLMAHENAEDIKFLGSQMDSLAADEDDSFFEINTQLRELYGRKWLLRMEPPQLRTNASPQFFDSEGFHDVVVGSRIESDDFVVFGAPDRRHNNGSVKGQSDLSKFIKPVHSGHVYIQKNQVRAFSDQLVDRPLRRSLPRSRRSHLERESLATHDGSAFRRRPRGWSHFSL